MKHNPAPFLIGAILGSFVLLFSCKSKDNQCDGDKSITGVAPNSNPPGYEVIISTNGFSETAQVRFGNETAESRAGEAGQVIARVPAGLAGNVQVTVEEGDCVARFNDFSVSGSLPSDLQLSLPDIVLPTMPSVYPSNFTNGWKNAADPSGQTGMFLFDDGTGIVHPSGTNHSYEFDGDNDTALDNNPISGEIHLPPVNTVYLEVDRTANGGIVEKFDGQFVNPPPNALYAMLLVSRQTGRQLLLLFF